MMMMMMMLSRGRWTAGVDTQDACWLPIGRTDNHGGKVFYIPSLRLPHVAVDDDRKALGCHGNASGVAT